jgi:hypothetical protein
VIRLLVKGTRAEAEKSAGRFGLLPEFVREIHFGPSIETVLRVPGDDASAVLEWDRDSAGTDPLRPGDLIHYSGL